MLAVSPSGWSEFDSLTAGDWAWLCVDCPPLVRPPGIYSYLLNARSLFDIDSSSVVCPSHFRCAQIHGHVDLSFSGASFGPCRRHGGRWAPILVYWACGAFHIWRSSVRSRHFSPLGPPFVCTAVVLIAVPLLLGAGEQVGQFRACFLSSRGEYVPVFT